MIKNLLNCLSFNFNCFIIKFNYNPFYFRLIKYFIIDFYKNFHFMIIIIILIKLKCYAVSKKINFAVAKIFS